METLLFILKNSNLKFLINTDILKMCCFIIALVGIYWAHKKFIKGKLYRRQKIGTKMFEYIYDFAKKNNCDFISLIAETENEAAQSFYDNLGYMREGRNIK